jgi:hypothetical protein
MEGFVEGADAISGKDENTFLVFKMRRKTVIS